MATESRIEGAMSLAEFLAWPRIDEKPYLEYHDGRIEVNESSMLRRGLLKSRLAQAVCDFARPRSLGMAFMALRCTFGSWSIVPDLVFLDRAKITTDERGRVVDGPVAQPDLHAEIHAIDRLKGRTVEKIEHSLRHGCPLGWFLDPDQRSVGVYRPGRAVEVLGLDGVLDGDPVLPGFRLAVAEVFGWLTYRKPKADPS